MAYHPPSDPYAPPNQLYTKYLSIYFQGILVASVRLIAVIRQDRFRASWCLSSVHFSHHCSIDHLGEIIVYTLPARFSLSLPPPAYSCSSLLSFVRVGGVFVCLLLQVGG